MVETERGLVRVWPAPCSHLHPLEHWLLGSVSIVFSLFPSHTHTFYDQLVMRIAVKMK